MSAVNLTAHRVALAGFLALLWILWSGHFTWLLLGCGLVSVLGVVMLVRRLGIDDDEGIPTPILTRALPGYLLWLCGQIVLANIDVIKCILGPRSMVAPCVVTRTSSSSHATAHVLLAQSITLTPGTITIYLDGKTLHVHALNPSFAAGVLDEQMDKRVALVQRS